MMMMMIFSIGWRKYLKDIEYNWILIEYTQPVVILASLESWYD